jgi:hypothetical protein
MSQPTPRLVAVRHRLEALVDLGTGTGIEIGPLNAPLVTSPPWDVRYVDVFGTDELMERYRADPSVTPEDIVYVHYTLSYDGGVRSLGEAAAAEAPYKWAVASHVAEHVPDLIGWLADIASLLDDDARLFLMLPDRRFTFDARRPPTTVGQMLEAYARRDLVPSERAVYDHFRSTIPQLPPTELWAGASVADVAPILTVEQAAEFRDAARRGEYVDCHVWVFTPGELVAHLSDLGELDLLDFTTEYVLPTPVDELEFTVVLRRIPRRASRAERMRLRRTALAALNRDAFRAIPSAQVS